MELEPKTNLRLEKATPLNRSGLKRKSFFPIKSLGKQVEPRKLEAVAVEKEIIGTNISPKHMRKDH